MVIRSHTLGSKFCVSVALLALASDPSKPYTHPYKKNSDFTYQQTKWKKIIAIRIIQYLGGRYKAKLLS